MQMGRELLMNGEIGRTKTLEMHIISGYTMF